MNLEIRQMTEADFPGYHACLDAVARERQFLTFLQAPPFEQSRAWISPHLQQGHPFFIAIADGCVAGWCDIIPNEREGFTHRGTLGIGVLATFRHLGIGRRLLRAAIAHARRIGIERIELDVFASNETARRLYESEDFVVEGTRRGARKLDGFVDDLILMVLLPSAA